MRQSGYERVKSREGERRDWPLPILLLLVLLLPRLDPPTDQAGLLVIAWRLLSIDAPPNEEENLSI